jgi:hypothetical protein
LKGGDIGDRKITYKIIEEYHIQNFIGKSIIILIMFNVMRVKLALRYSSQLMFEMFEMFEMSELQNYKSKRMRRCH